jgi:lysophospholipase L1-like esterase
LLRNFATEQKIDIVDMNIYLSDLDKNVLKEQYTIDGVHYTTSAYLIWAEQIQEILKKHRI